MDILSEKKEELKKIILESNHISAYVGLDMVSECGYIFYNDDEDAYDLEIDFGFDFYELFSAKYYETRTKQFFEFYKKYILQNHTPLGGFVALYNLQKMGKLKSVVSRDIYSLAKRVGCRKTVELNGNIFDNKCQKCGKKHPMNYMKRAKGVPACSMCSSRIRPNVMLFGETRNNGLITTAANAIEKADMLLILGTHLNDEGDQDMFRYYRGNKMVLIHRTTNGIDVNADLLIEGSCNGILSEVVGDILK